MRKSPVGCFLVILVLLVAGIPFMAFTMRANSAQQAAERAANTTYYVVQPGDVEVAVSAIGRAEVASSASLTFSSAGRVAEVLVEVGQTVSAGSVIARLENDAQQIGLEQAEMAVEMARLRREDTLQGPDSGQIAVAQANIDAALGSYYALSQGVSADDLRAAELAVQQAEAAEADARFARNTAQGGQPEQAYTLLDAQVGQASFNTQIARLQLEQLQSGTSGQLGAAWARVEQARADLARLQAGPLQSQIDSADAAIAQAEAARDRAQAALDDTLLVAPFDGVITSLNLEVGAIATTALPVGEIADLNSLRIRVDVDEIDLRQISPDMAAAITFDALDDVIIPAQIEQIAVVGTNNNGIVNYPMTLRLTDTPDPRIRVGMTAEARVVVESQRGVLLIPNAYIRLDRQRGQAFVNVVNSAGELEEIEITLGLQGDDSSEVVSGLNASDVIAVNLGGDTIPAFGG